jgi:hypothetical protein
MSAHGGWAKNTPLVCHIYFQSISWKGATAPMKLVHLGNHKACNEHDHTLPRYHIYRI